jgi:hypothetical protein
MDNKELCINLSKAETEKEVVDLLIQGCLSTFSPSFFELPT